MMYYKSSFNSLFIITIIVIILSLVLLFMTIIITLYITIIIRILLILILCVFYSETGYKIILLNKMDVLKVWINSTNADVIVLSETWLTNSVLDKDISINGYNVYRADRPRKGGGVAMDIESNCDFEEEGRRHRIAFNSLYLFSFRSIIYEANGEELYNFTRGATLNWISIDMLPGVSGLPPWGAFDSILEAWPP